MFQVFYPLNKTRESQPLRRFFLLLSGATAFLAFFAFTASCIEARVYSTRDEALKRAFPNASSIEKRSLYLDAADVSRVEKASGVKTDSRLFTYYEAKGKSGVLGYAVIAGHTVRTKQEIYMVVIAANGAIDFVEILAFYEPEEYMPPKRWLAIFSGRALTNALRPKQEIPLISGATITTYTLTAEVRKTLAIFELLVLGGKR